MTLIIYKAGKGFAPIPVDHESTVPLLH